MSSFIGQLRISLGLDSAAFESGAKRAAAEVNTLGTKAERAGFKVGSMTKALVAGASAFAASAIVGQLKDAVAAGLDYASSLGETAQQLGVTTKTLQEYRYAADQVGISQEDMDAGLAKLTRTIGLAIEGNKKQVQAFERLGISVRGANGEVKDAGDIIPELAEALQKVGSPAERAAVLVELFGKSGQKMGSLLADGAKGVNSLRQDAQKLGIVLSDEMINNADAAADSMGKLNRVLEAQISAAVAENAKEIAELTNTLTQFAISLVKSTNEWVRFQKAIDNRSKMRADFETALDARAKAEGWTAQKKEEVRRGGYAIIDKRTATKTVAQDPFGLFQFNQVGSQKTNFAGGALLGSNIANIAAQAPGLRTPLFENLLYQTEEIQKSFLEVPKAANDTAEETETQTVRIARSFADMAQDTVSSLQNMSNSIRSGDFLSILGSAVGLFTQLASTGLFGKSLAARVNAIPAYANGTSFHPGGLALVGERGPEVVQLPRGAAVYRHGTGPGGGGPYFDLRGAVMTEDLLKQMNAIGAVSAQAGGEIGYNKVVRTNSRRLG